MGPSANAPALFSRCAVQLGSRRAVIRSHTAVQLLLFSRREAALPYVANAAVNSAIVATAATTTRRRALTEDACLCSLTPEYVTESERTLARPSPFRVTTLWWCGLPARRADDDACVWCIATTRASNSSP